MAEQRVWRRQRGTIIYGPKVFANVLSRFRVCDQLINHMVKPTYVSSLHHPQHVQIKYNLYYFQVQNMAETLQGARPKLMQVGPYAYDEYYVKFDISWSDGGDTVTYNTQKYYLFNQDETGPGLSQEDQLTLPYATVIGFNYLLSTVDATDQMLIDAGIHVRHKNILFLLVSTCKNLTNAPFFFH